MNTKSERREAKRNKKRYAMRVHSRGLKGQEISFSSEKAGTVTRKKGKKGKRK